MVMVIWPLVLWLLVIGYMDISYMVIGYEYWVLGMVIDYMKGLGLAF
jgi:hypothetical protein